MYILLCGEPPFQGETEEEIFANIKKGKYSFSKPEFSNVSDNCKDLIRKLLEPNKKNRIKASEALKHPFFTENYNPNMAMVNNVDKKILKKLLEVKKLPSKFHELIEAYLAYNFLKKDEQKKLTQVFRYIDHKGKNRLSKIDFEKTFKEQMMLYYKIYIEASDMIVMVPVEKAEELGIRQIVSAKEAQKALDLLSADFEPITSDWKLRYQMNLELLKKGTISDIAEIVRCLYNRSKVKELPILERKLYDSAKKLLEDEIAYALGKTSKEIEQMIHTKLEPLGAVTKIKHTLQIDDDEDDDLMDDVNEKSDDSDEEDDLDDNDSDSADDMDESDDFDDDEQF